MELERFNDTPVGALLEHRLLSPDRRDRRPATDDKALPSALLTSSALRLRLVEEQHSPWRRADSHEAAEQGLDRRDGRRTARCSSRAPRPAGAQSTAGSWDQHSVRSYQHTVCLTTHQCSCTDRPSSRGSGGAPINSGRNNQLKSTPSNDGMICSAAPSSKAHEVGTNAPMMATVSGPTSALSPLVNGSG